MSALPNPMQELAEKLKDCVKWVDDGGYGYEQLDTEKALPILTACVGTLLQAERAASALQMKENMCSFLGFGTPAEIQARHCPLTPTDASALSAVVQRELERDRENFVIRGVVERKSFDQICNERDELERETAKLREWKESASNILNQLDLQAIGKEIGLHLGQEVSPNVLPAIKNLKALLRRCYDMGNLPDKLETDIRAALQ